MIEWNDKSLLIKIMTKNNGYREQIIHQGRGGCLRENQ